jgi:3-oxoadipate enol-lactonase
LTKIVWINRHTVILIGNHATFDQTEATDMPVLKVDSQVSLYYEEHGKGFPLVLIHGLLSDLATWRYQITPFSKHYRVITLDLKGHGQSFKPTREYRVASHADDVYHLLQKLRIPQAHLCGLSMGGMVAEVVAIRYPKMVRGLVLADSAAMIADDAVSDRLTLIKNHDMKWFADWGIKKITRIATPEAKEHVRKMIARVGHDDYRLAIISTAGFNIAADLAQITAPTLIIVGEKDETTPLWHADQIHNWLPGSRLVVMKDASHMTPVENPQEFNKLVLDFLAEVDKTATK